MVCMFVTVSVDPLTSVSILSVMKYLKQPLNCMATIVVCGFECYAKVVSFTWKMCRGNHNLLYNEF